MQSSRIYAIGATRIIVGLSAIVKVGTVDSEAGAMVKILSGGGTLEIVPIPIALTGASAAGWNLGYPIGANEIFMFHGPATYYLAATGATMTLAFAPAYSSGVTLTV